MRACAYGGETRFPAQLDDYAFSALGFLELYRASFDPVHIISAAKQAEQITARFAAPSGGFYRTAQDAEQLITRPMEVFDGAMPSGNSAAAQLFVSLARLTRRGALARGGGETAGVHGRIRRGAAAGMAFALCAMMELIYPAKELVCAAADEEEPAMLAAVPREELRSLRCC